MVKSSQGLRCRGISPHLTPILTPAATHTYTHTHLQRLHTDARLPLLLTRLPSLLSLPPALPFLPRLSGVKTAEG